MVMKLYGMGSMNCQRAILPLFEAEEDVEKDLELVNVSIRDGQQLQPIYTAKQPFRMIPYYEDGDVTIYGKQLM